MEYSSKRPVPIALYHHDQDHKCKACEINISSDKIFAEQLHFEKLDGVLDGIDCLTIDIPHVISVNIDDKCFALAVSPHTNAITVAPLNSVNKRFGWKFSKCADRRYKICCPSEHLATDSQLSPYLCSNDNLLKIDVNDQWFLDPRVNGKYVISNPHSSNTFNSDYSKFENVEYFDVYTPPITSR